MPADASPLIPAGAGLAQLAAAAAGCRACELGESATQTVFGRGPAAATIALVGEQPGDVEDRRGLPFVGPAGMLLVRALDAAGIDRSAVYVTNAVKHFRFTLSGPSRRRLHASPEARHILACRPWLAAELNTVRPRVVVALGATAARSLVGPAVRITRDRGRVLPGPVGSGAQLLVTGHPAAVLREPAGSRDEAFGALVTDLRTAARLAAGPAAGRHE